MDAELLTHLIGRHAPALELYARQWCEAPEDVVQEAFVRLAGQARPPDSPVAWLFRTVRHRAINAGRAHTRRRAHEARAAAEAPAWFEPDPSAALDPDAAGAALAALPLPQREVIVAHLWGGLTFEQIGALVGASTSSAHRLYQAGLAGLRDRLGDSERCHTTTRPNQA